MDYTDIRQVMHFLREESINAKTCTKLPKIYKPILDIISVGEFENIRGRIVDLNEHTKLISIQNAIPISKKRVIRAFISNVFRDAIFIFVDPTFDEKQIKDNVDEIISRSKNTNANSDLHKYLKHWVNIIKDILSEMNIDVYIKSGSLIERQFNMLPAILLTRVNHRINDYFEKLSAQDIYDKYSDLFTDIFPGKILLSPTDYKQCAIKLSSIAINENPIVNCI